MSKKILINTRIDLTEQGGEQLDLRKKRKKFVGRREIIIAVIAVILTSAGIKASDSFSGAKSAESVDLNGCPLDMVFVNTNYGGFCVDKYEVSAGEACSHNNPSSQSESAFNLGAPECKPVSIVGKTPWRNITQTQAIEACAKAGKRLPSSKEWFLASLGTPDKNSSWSSDDCQVSKNWISQPGLTGSASNCVSSAGAFDMIGNVWEWVQEEVIDGKYNDTVMPESGYVTAVSIEGMPIETVASGGDVVYNEDYLWIKNKGVRGMARGGYWDNKADAGKNAIYLVSPPSFAGVGMGFRCVK